MEWLGIFIVAIGLIAFVEWKLNEKHGYRDENPFEIVKQKVTRKKTRKRTVKAKAGGGTKTTRKKTTKNTVKLGGGNRRK